MIRWWGLLAGIVLGMLAYLLVPEQYTAADGETQILGHAGRLTAGLACTMAVWWMTEAIPVFATALLPVLVLPIGQAASLEAATSPYADDLIFLFLGGFVLALAMQRTGLHRRIALITLRLFGTRPPLIVAGFMTITATLSMWVSNTATTMMMLPIGISLIQLMVCRSDQQDQKSERFSLALMLAIAYSASIGGLGTLIGSPPNGLVASFAEQQLGTPIGFVDWMKWGVPLVIVLLPIAWGLLVGTLRISWQPVDGGAEFLAREIKQLGKISQAELSVLLTFLMTAGLWLVRPLLNQWEFDGTNPLAGVNDASIAILAALVLFALPTSFQQLGTRVMDWETMIELPWGVLLLFGGGLSLAAAIDSTGVSGYLGASIGTLQEAPGWVVTLAVIVLIVFLTEITSNTATVAAMLPILAAVASGIGVAPLTLLVPAALAGSCAFMLPVATPPNAIVFGTGKVSIRQMATHGWWLNLVCIVVLLVFAQWLP